MAKYINADEYISKQEVIGIIAGVKNSIKFDNLHLPEMLTCLNLIIKLANATPPADVAEVKHAHWNQADWQCTNDWFKCSNCKEEYEFTAGEPKDYGFDYCPHCGAQMDGDPQ